jgi:crotonobetaine/carnitine-CoA ligase
MTMRAFWERRVELTPDVAFLIADDGSWTYEAFDRWVNRLAAGLREARIGAGTHVALLLPSGVPLMRIEWALQKLGAVWVPLIPGATPPEIRFVIEHSQAQVLITDGAGWAAANADGQASPSLRVFVVGGGVGGAEDLAALDTDDEAAPAPSAIGPGSPMAIMYTSGSTGRPKGAILPNAGFRTVADAVAERLAIDERDRWYCVMPLFHSGATHLIVGPAIAAGASVLVRERFSRSAFWSDVRGHGATASLLMPAMLSMLLTDPPRADDRDNPLRVVFSHVRHEAFVERFDVDVCPGWALTETLGIGALTRAGTAEHPPGFVGTPSPANAEVRVVDAAERALPPGERGELCVRHPHVFVGYHRDPENTRRTLRDGWVHTGDLGEIDEQGQVFFRGRLKNVIKRAGENIAGEELELALSKHPAVEECIVTGVEDPIRTEEAYATVLVRDGARLTEDELVRWCVDRLSDWKIPRFVRLVRGELPRLANGKTDRLAIRAAADRDAAWDREAPRALSYTANE